MTMKNVEILCIVREGTRKFTNRVGWIRSIVLEDKAKHLERHRSFSFSDRKVKRDEGSLNGTIDDHRGRDGTKMDRRRRFRVTRSVTLFGFVFVRVAARNCIKGFLHDLSCRHSYTSSA